MANLLIDPVVADESSDFVDIVVRLDAAAPSVVTVTYDSSNSTAGGNDYVYPGGTLTFQPGETSKTVRVQLRPDPAVEPPEVFFFTLRSATGAAIATPATPITLIDNDTVVATPRLFVDDLHVDEKQGVAQFIVRLGRDLGESSNTAVSVRYTTRDLSATAGQDYAATSGLLTFEPGQSVKTVSVPLLDDGLAEGAERFELVLGEAVNASIAQGTALAQIALSDGVGSSQPRISVAPLTVGESNGFIDLPVRLHAPSTLPVTVSYDSSNSTAGGNDHVYPGGTLIFQPGETLKTVRVQLRDDTGAEPPELFFFTLRNAVNATIETPAVPVTVVDNDTVVETPRLFVDDVHVDEKQGTAQFVVRLGRDLGEAANGVVTVAYTTRDGTALAGQDYAARSGTLSFQPGEVTKTITVDLIDDGLAEPTERFGLVLAAPVNAALGDAHAAAQIALSDGPGGSQPRVEVSPVTVSEGDRFVDLPVRLHAPTTLPVTVSYDSANSTAGGNDYVYPGGTLVFQPGETLKSVRVQLRDDIVSEGTEVFSFVLRNATNATIPQPSVAVTILDNDGPRPLLSQGFGDDVYTIDTTAVDFIEAADGGFDVVRSSASFTLPAELEGIVLTGSALNATGNDRNNFFSGNASSNTIDGRGGIDTVALASRDSDYAVSGSVASRTITRAGEGTDTLLSIERLQFANVVQAWDTTPGGNTWGAFALLNAAFNQAPDLSLLGQWTSVLDRSNGNMDELARQLIQWYAPGVGNEALVVHLWSTVVETPITPGDLASFVGLIDNGTYTQASLAVLASTHPLNTDEFASLVGQPMLLDPAWFPLPGG